MATVYLDPNSDPEATYWQLEGLLLLFEKEFVYGPNATAIQWAARSSRQAHVLADRFVRLVERGYVVPVAGPQYWDQTWRDKRSAQLRPASRPRSEFYRWTDFDEKISAFGRRETAFHDAADRAKRMPENAPDVFAAVLPQVSRLRSAGKLPRVFSGPDYRSSTDEDVCRKLLYDLGGDVALLRLLGADSVIVSEAQAGLYRVYDVLSRHSPSSPRRILPDLPPERDGELSHEDFRIARELADRIAGNHELVDVLDEYRRSKFHRLFRLWVHDTLLRLQSQGYRGGDLVSGLTMVFSESARKRENARGHGGTALGGAASLLAPDPRFKEFIDAVVSRRLFLRVAGVVGGVLAGGWFLPPPLAQVAGEITAAPDSWIALIALEARRRTPA